MRGWSRLLGLVLAACVLVSGCKSSANVAITMTPTAATVLVGQTTQFTATVSNGGAVNWSVNGVANGNTTVGTVSTTGLYTAPLSVPVTAGTPPTATPIAVTATLQTDASVTGSATVTLDSGVRVTITPSSFTLGTNETYQFSAVVTGVPPAASIVNVCNADSAPPSNVPYCNSVTWTVSPTTNAGTVDSNGNYTAPPPSEGTSVLVTATSIFDTTRTGSASVAIVTATPPTLTSVSPTNAARGGLFQDVYLTGANFLSTTSVLVSDPVNGTRQVPSSNVLVPQPGLTSAPASTVGTLIHVRLPDLFLTTAPVSPAQVATLTFSVAQQPACQNQGACMFTPIACASSPTLTPCQLSLAPVRPAVVGTSPDSIPQGTGSPIAFNVNGGFFGTTLNPTVTATFGGTETKFPSVSGTNSTRQMTVTIGGGGSAGDVTTPGLFPVAISSNVNPAASVVSNIAIQPSYPASTINPLVNFTTVGTNVGASPAALAINTTTGIAVVANQGSNDVELIDLTKTTPAVVGFICVGSSGSSLTATEAAPCPAAGPVSVAVDNVYNVALVADAATNSIAVVDLNLKQTTAVVAPCQANGPLLCIPLNTGLTPPAPFVPVAVGVNPVNHLGIVAYQTTNVASILDVTQSPAAVSFAGVVNISTGPHARVAVSPRLDWAVVTPGGLGSLSIVDLARQTANVIAPSAAQSPGASRTSGIVTITTTTAQDLQVGEPVLITGVTDASFDGIYSVYSVPSSTSFTYLQTNFSSVPANATGGGGMISYAFPVATLATSLTTEGVALNDQTQKAILTDTGGSTPGTVFTVLDQSSTTIPLPNNNPTDGSYNLAVAVNPLANLGVIVNQVSGDAMVIDPSAPSVLTTITNVGTNPVDAAIDPGTDIAVFVNQGTPPSVSIYSLGALRPLQVLETSVAPTVGAPPPLGLPCPTTSGPIVSGPSVLVCSVGGAPAVNSAVSQTLTIIGSGFTPNSKARLDGQVLQTAFVSGREITAIVTTGFQSAARRYALDVADSGVVSNATSFTVVESVNLMGITQNCSTPSPQAVAIDANLNQALVTDSGLGCNQVYLINLASGAVASTVEVSTDPQGIAVFPRLGVAVVANQGSNSASVINETPCDNPNCQTNTTLATVTTDSGPTGVAIDQDLGEALVAASGGNVADEISISGTNSAITAGSSNALTAQAQPTSVAVDSVTHLAAVGNITSNDVTVLSLSQTTATNTTSTIEIPQGIALDPCPASACNANSEFLPNPNFLITASLQNQVEILDPTTGVLTPFRVGINPTALAYNVATSTLVTLNQLSQTMTVIDYLARQVRAVFPITPSSQFGVDINSQTNLAVVADSANSRVLLLPLPQ